MQHITHKLLKCPRVATLPPPFKVPRPRGNKQSPGSDPALSSPYEAALGPRGAGEKRLGARGAHECQARGRAGGKGGAGLGAKLLTVVIDREGRQG